jgi:glycosyltransferase involved in cell wall biosynthesis
MGILIMIDISIVIATWNRGAKLAGTLSSLAAQTLPPDRWEAVVVNNNSTDDTAEVFARFVASPAGRMLNVRMVDEPRQGLSWARNRGLAEVRGRIVAMIDDDEEVNPGFLAAYLDFFASHPQALAAGGPMVARYEQGRPRWMSHYTEALAASTIDLGRRVRQFPRGRYPIGGNMAFRSEVFERVGLFDTALGRTGGALLGGEEKDLFDRIGRLDGFGGEIWWVPGATVDHLIPPSRLTDKHFRRLSRMVGATARILSKSRGAYPRALLAEALKWCATLLLAAWFTLTLRPSKARYLIIMRREITAGLLSEK